jgi:hypothetical protein
MTRKRISRPHLLSWPPFYAAFSEASIRPVQKLLEFFPAYLHAANKIPPLRWGIDLLRRKIRRHKDHRRDGLLNEAPLWRGKPHLILACETVANVAVAIPAVVNPAVAENLLTVSLIAESNVVVQDEDSTAAFSLSNCHVLSWRGLPSEEAANRETGIVALDAVVEKEPLRMPALLL